MMAWIVIADRQMAGVVHVNDATVMKRFEAARFPARRRRRPIGDFSTKLGLSEPGQRP
jgi:hypothetical protein